MGHVTDGQVAAFPVRDLRPSNHLPMTLPITGRSGEDQRCGPLTWPALRGQLYCWLAAAPALLARGSEGRHRDAEASGERRDLAAHRRIRGRRPVNSQHAAMAVHG